MTKARALLINVGSNLRIVARLKPVYSKDDAIAGWIPQPPQLEKLHYDTLNAESWSQYEGPATSALSRYIVAQALGLEPDPPGIELDNE